MTKAITAMLVYLTKEVNYFITFLGGGGGGGAMAAIASSAYAL